MDGFNNDKPVVVGNEGWDVYAELDGSDNLVTRYINGDATNQVFARIDANGAAWLLTDALNSTRDVIDNTGTLLDHIDYDAFGTITYELNPTLAGTILFTGDHYDAETGFDFSRARYLDPTTGRWTTQDPLSFDAGDPNLYRYVLNGPSAATDPSGAATWGQVFKVGGGIALGGGLILGAAASGFFSGPSTRSLVGMVARNIQSNVTRTVNNSNWSNASGFVEINSTNGANVLAAFQSAFEAQITQTRTGVSNTLARLGATPDSVSISVQVVVQYTIVNATQPPPRPNAVDITATVVVVGTGTDGQGNQLEVSSPVSNVAVSGTPDITGVSSLNIYGQQ